MRVFLQKTTLILSLAFLPIFSFSQIELSLKLNYDSTKWGVFARPAADITPSKETVTGSGQVTVVAPTGFVWSGMKSLAGAWMQNARTNAPMENPKYDYISVGLFSDSPKILYQKGFETLLFSFDRIGDCPDTLFLIQDDDPFSNPNSAGTNPNNDLFIIDTETGGSYTYLGNYDLCAWSCRECTLEEETTVTSTNSWTTRPFRIFPNPASNQITIKTEKQLEKIQIFDLLGNLVINEAFKSEKVNVSKLRPGFYSIQLETKEGEIMSEKLQIINLP